MDFSIAFEGQQEKSSTREIISDHLREAFERTGFIPCFWRTYSHGVFGDALLARTNWGITRTCPVCLQKELDLLSLSHDEEIEEEDSSAVTYYVLWVIIQRKVVPIMLSPREASSIWLYITNLHGIPPYDFPGLDHSMMVSYENDSLKVVPGRRSKQLLLKKDGIADVKQLFELWRYGKIPRLRRIISEDDSLELYPLYFITRTYFEKVVRGFFIPLYFHYLKTLPLTGWNIVAKYYDKFGIDYDDIPLIAEAVHEELSS